MTRSNAKFRTIHPEGIVAFTVFLLVCLLTTSIPARAAQVLDGVVAVVNKGVILRSDLETTMQQVKSNLRAQGRQLPPQDVLRKQVLDHLILQRIQVQEANQRGITVDKVRVTQMLQNLADSNHMTLPQFQSAVEREGLDVEQIRKQLHDQLLIDKLRRQEIQHQVTVTDRDVDLYLDNQKNRGDSNDSYHLLHILVAVPEEARTAQVAKARAKAKALLDKIHKGESFAQAAISDSDGQQALKGGDIGWFKSGALPSIFSDAVPKMKAGQVSGLIRSPSGFHIVKIAAIKGENTDSVTETHAEHILLRITPKRGPQQTKALAAKLYNELQNGTSFGALARQYSDDQGSASKGGDLGWQPPGSFVPRFEQTLAKLQPDQLSQPFETRYGWHIAKVLGRRQERVSDKMRRQQARETIGERRAKEHYELWLHRLRDEAYVEYRTGGSGQPQRVNSLKRQQDPLSFGAGS